MKTTSADEHKRIFEEQLSILANKIKEEFNLDNNVDGKMTSILETFLTDMDIYKTTHINYPFMITETGVVYMYSPYDILN